MRRPQHLSARAGTSAPALPVAIARDGDFSGVTDRSGQQGHQARREAPVGHATIFRQLGLEHPTAAGTSPSAAPVGPCLCAAGAGILFFALVAQAERLARRGQWDAGSSPARGASLRRAPLRKHEVDAGATCTWRSCPRPTGRTISKQPCDWRGLSAAGEQGGATATAAPNHLLARSAAPGQLVRA